MAATFTPVKSSTFIIGDPWGVTQAERTRQSLLTCAFRTFDLGGLRESGIDGTSIQTPFEYRDITLPGADLQGFIVQARIEARTDATTTSVTPQIYNTSTAAVTAGIAVTATAWVEQVITMSLGASTQKFRLRVTKSNANALVYAIGVIEILMP